MATILNAGTTAATSLNVITDTTGAMAIQTSGTTAISIDNAQVVSLTNPLLPASGGTGITSLGTGVATFLGTPSSANLAAALTDETGTGTVVFSASPALTGVPTAPTASAGTNTTQLATTAFVTQNAVLTGALLMWPTASAPSGYLLCDGTAVSRTTYAALYAVVGTTFGVGDGSTTFNVPNYQGRSPLGSSGSYALASTGGSADAVVVSHTHTASSSVSDPGHVHGVNGHLYGGGGNPGGDWNGYGDYGNTTFSNTTGITVATSNSTTGVSGTGANLQPYLAINFIIKT
jgi:microcystin-dependent protein